MTRSCKVLILEDDVGDVEILLRLFRAFKELIVEPVVVHSAHELLTSRIYSDDTIDIFLVDYLLDNVSGIDVVSSLKDLNCKKPVIMLTGQGDENVAVEAMKNGILDYIVKSRITSAGLERSILNALEKHHMKQELIEQELRLKYLSVTDDLTKLKNRRYLFDYFESELKHFHLHKEVFSLIIIDLDHFKAVNDNYGHIVGDEVLKKFGQIIIQELRTNDVGARYGGEEFCILLPKTNEEGALNLAERIRAELERVHFDAGAGKTFQVTCSLGIEVCNTKGATLEELLKNADSALYESKYKGRNQVTLHGKSAG